MFSTILTKLYPVCGVVLIASYLPQIRVVWADTSGARAVSLVAWGFWVMTSAISSLYAWLVVADFAFTCVSLGSLLGSSGVLGAALWRRFGCHQQLHGARPGAALGQSVLSSQNSP
jgi:hypothetical protein